MNSFSISIKFEGSGAKVKFTESEQVRNDEGIMDIVGKKYEREFQARGAAVEAVNATLSRYIRSLGTATSAQLELKSEPRTKKAKVTKVTMRAKGKAKGKGKGNLAAVPPPSEANAE